MFITKSTSGLIDRDNGSGHLRDQFTLEVCRQGDGRRDHRLWGKLEIEPQLFHERLLAEGLSLLAGG